MWSIAGAMQTQTRGYLRAIPGLSIERQREMAADARCDVIYEHGEHRSARDLWVRSLRSGDTAWLASVRVLILPRDRRPARYRPGADLSGVLARICALGCTIVDARAAIDSRDPKSWGQHVEREVARAASGERDPDARIASLAIAPREAGLAARWLAPAMADRLAMQRAIWTSAGTIEAVRKLLDVDLAGRSVRALYAILGPRRPNDLGAGGRGRKRDR